MTNQEHRLVVFMMAQQFQRFMALIEALKSKGVLEHDDIIAYEHLVNAQEDIFPRFFAETARQYEEFGARLGLHVQIEDTNDTTQNPIS